MAEKTALWTWHDRYEDVSTITFGAAELDYIRKLHVWWDSAENGAAGLTDDTHDLDEFEADQEALIDLFLNTATLPKRKGRIKNPHASSDDRWLLDDIPDPDIKALFLAGSDIDYEVSDTDLALWAEANLCGGGINCKRPFGSESVSRDLHAILDPEKALSNHAFGKLRKTVEARMMLMLQFFVQTADLPFDTYTRDAQYQWVPESSLDRAAGEELDWEEWALRVMGIVHDQCEDFTKTAMATEQLVWEDRLKGDYAALNKGLRLHDLYEDFNVPRYVGYSREMAEAGLRAFPEDEKPLLEKAITACLIRILNGTGDFEAARAAMIHAGVWEVDPETCEIAPPNPETMMALEGLIARMGLGDMTVDAFELALGRATRGASSFRFDILHDLGYWSDGCPDDMPLYRYSRARAIAAQLGILRGPYRP